MKRWLRYGIVGNLLSYGVGFGFIAYMGTSHFIQGGSSMMSGKVRPPKWMINWQKNYSPLPMANSRKVPRRQK